MRHVVLTALAALLVLGTVSESLAVGEPDPTLDQIRRGQIRKYPKMEQQDQDLIREGWRVFSTSERFGWPLIRKTFPGPTLLLTEEHQYLMGHPNPPESFFLTARSGDFYMNIYGKPAEGPCEGSDTRPLFGAPTIVKASVSCTGEPVTQWLFDYARLAFRLYLYHQNELLKYTRLRLPLPDPEGKWKREFPFPYDDPEVVASFRDLGLTVHRMFWDDNRAVVAGLVSEYLEKRQRLREILQARSVEYSNDDFLTYIEYSDGIAYYGAFESMSTIQGANAPVRHMESYTPYGRYTSADLLPSHARFREITEEPITIEDMMILGALTTKAVRVLVPEWRERILARDAWLEDLMARVDESRR